MPPEEVSVSDVYDLACDIGKECELLIAEYGVEKIDPLIKKIIVSLELLETFASRNEEDNGTISQLQESLRVETEKVSRIERNRQNFQIDIELIEKQWQGEVQRLQNENKRLLSMAAVDPSQPQQPPSPVAQNAEEVAAELESMQKLFRNEIRRRNDEFAEMQSSLQSQIDNLKAANTDCRRLQSELQAQVRSLVNERTALISRIQDQHTQIASLKRSVPNTEGASSAAADASAKLETAVNEPEEEAAVQGPMPYEPEDAPWRRTTRRDSESGIRKFFRQLFLEPDKAPFVHGTFGALSRI